VLIEIAKLHLALEFQSYTQQCSSNIAKKRLMVTCIEWLAINHKIFRGKCAQIENFDASR